MSHSIPSERSMAKAAAKAAADEVKALVAGQPSVEETEVSRRLALCEKCELFIHEQKRCSQCGCFMKFKAKLRSQHCPVGKW